MKTTLARATLAKATLVALSIILVSLIFTSPGSAKIAPKTVAGVWLLDEGSGTVATDSSGNGNDGEITGNPKWVEGVFGKALELDGSSYLVRVPFSESLAIEDEITITVWAKWNQFGDCGLISRSADGQGDGDYFISQGCCNPGEKMVMFSAGTASGAKGGSLETDEWFHVAGTFDGTEVLTWLNGEVVGNSSGGNLALHEWDVLIGSYAGKGYKFNGVLDDIAIFNAALEEDDIVKIMNEGLDVALGYAAVSPKEKRTTIWGKIKAEN